MPSRTLILEGSIVEIRPAIVLSVSNNLALAAALYEAPWRPPDWIEQRLEAALKGEHREALSGLRLDEAAILIATLYGGVVLVVDYDPPTPAARTMPLHGLELTNGDCEKSMEDDKTVLQKWASMFWSMPSDGCSWSPPGIGWRFPGPVRVAPAGYRSKPAKQNSGS